MLVPSNSPVASVGAVPSAAWRTVGTMSMEAQGVPDDLAARECESWVMSDGGHSDAAVEEAEFVAFESAGGASVVRVECSVEPVSGFAGWAVVGDEEGEGVFGFPEACKFVHDCADGVVDGADHCGHDASVPR